MSFESYISLLSTLGIVLLGQRVLMLDRKNPVYWVLFLLSIVLAMLTLSWYEMSQATSYDEALFYRRHIAPWPIVFYAVGLLSFLQVRRKLPVNHILFRYRKVLAVALFIPAVYFIYLDYCTDHVYGGLGQDEKGRWAYHIEQASMLDYMRSFWVAFVFFIALIFNYYNYKFHRYSQVKRVLKMANIVFFISAVVVYFHVFVLPYFGIPIIHNASVSSFVTMLVYSWAFTDFKLFKVQPESAVEAIVQNMTNLLILTDKQMKIKKVNSAFAKLFNIKEEDIMNRPLQKVFRRVDIEVWESCKKHFRAVNKSKQIERFEVALKCQGRNCFLLITITPIFNKRNKQTGYAIIGTDLTDYKEAEQAMLKHARELEKSNETLERFAYIASHDLKEPVRTANGFIGLLERRLKNNEDEGIKEYLGFIKDNMKRMFSLIDSALMVSRYNSLDVKLVSFEPTRLIQQIEQNLNAMIGQKNARIYYNNLPEVVADKNQMELLFQNLVENGLKYNESEEPVISISCEARDNYYEFAFTDNGIGISADYKEQVFQMFKRLHSRESKYEGTGIGLAICKRIVEKHQGEIWVESKEGEGTTFKFTIPNMN